MYPLGNIEMSAFIMDVNEKDNIGSMFSLVGKNREDRSFCKREEASSRASISKTCCVCSMIVRIKTRVGIITSSLDTY